MICGKKINFGLSTENMHKNDWPLLLSHLWKDICQPFFNFILVKLGAIFGNYFYFQFAKNNYKMQTTGFEKKKCLHCIITIIWVTLSQVKLEREINLKDCLMLGHIKMLQCSEKNIILC